MAVVTERPSTTHYIEERSSPVGWILGLAALIIFAYFLFVYGIPALNRAGSSGTTINVPDKINVNTNPAPQ